MKTLHEWRETVTEKFRAVFEQPQMEADALLGALLGFSRAELILKETLVLTEDQNCALAAAVDRRRDKEPLAYIVGFKDFYKNRFLIRPGVLIPRPETELIVETALAFYGARPPSNILDLGCGSGCIGLSLLSEWSDSRLIAIDAEAVAVETTRVNADRLSVQDRCQTKLSTVEKFEPETAVDLIVANPPYIAESGEPVDEWVRRFEPASALFAAESGLQAIRTWGGRARDWLSPGGFFICEIGATQAASAKGFLKGFGFTSIECKKDLAGWDRIIIGKKGM